MHPDGPVDAGMIVLAHQESRRAKYKRAHQRILKAAAPVPQDAACAAPAEESDDEPAPKRTGGVSDRQQTQSDEVNTMIEETELLNRQAEELLNDVDFDEENMV